MVTILLRRRETPIGHEYRSRDETRLRRGQKDDRFRDLLWPRGAADWMMGPEALEQRATVGDRIAEESGHHRAGRHGIDADTARGEFDCERARDLKDGALRGRV